MNQHINVDTLTGSTLAPSTSAKNKQKSFLTMYRCMVLYRFILAIFGGYVLATLTAIVTAKFFEDYRISAVMSATLLAFCTYCGAFIWVFMVNKTLKASLGIIIPSIVLFIIYQILGH